MTDTSTPPSLTIQGTTIEQGELDAAFIALRTQADASGYGHWITDAALKETAAAVVTAVENYRNGKTI